MNKKTFVTMDYKEKLEEAKRLYETANADQRYVLESLFPELEESEDERIKKALIEYFNEQCDMSDWNGVYGYQVLAWLEKQGEQKPNYCHHEVDLSGCSEEYRKAYCDGWNNCNMQHSQCKSELDDVVKCLINGMKFYYEDNKDATWGTEKFSMKVKDILSWLEKQGEQNPAWSEEDAFRTSSLTDVVKSGGSIRPELRNEFVDWLKSLKERYTWKPSDKQLKMLDEIIDVLRRMQLFGGSNALIELKHDLKKLRGE